MSQRFSEYARRPHDAYETPHWVTHALAPHVPAFVRTVWEPAAGAGQMAQALRDLGYAVTATDIGDGKDFLNWCGKLPAFDAIVTNPPFNLSREFIEHALQLTKARRGFVAMLLRVDYDSAATRQHLFADCEAFALKLVLTKRIVWFDRPGAAPSFNHAWLVWSWQHSGPPRIAYGPTAAVRLPARATPAHRPGSVRVGT